MPSTDMSARWTGRWEKTVILMGARGLYSERILDDRPFMGANALTFGRLFEPKSALCAPKNESFVLYSPLAICSASLSVSNSVCDVITWHTVRLKARLKPPRNRISITHRIRIRIALVITMKKRTLTPIRQRHNWNQRYASFL